VLLPLGTFRAANAAELYDGVHAIDWAEHLQPTRTLAVDVAGKDAPAGPGHFIALKTKDAIVDRIREAKGVRPNVDTKRPDFRVNVHVRGDRVTINLDLSGRGLHRRGFGRAGSEAPLKENLAATILRIAGWTRRDHDAPFFDPMCGSATLLIEAAWMALDVAPGLMRKRIGAEGWRGHDASIWKQLRAEAEDRKRASSDRALRIAGSDLSTTAITTARDNLRRAGLGAKVRVEHRDLRECKPPWPDPGTLVTNPPYGERLGDSGELGPLYELLGDVLKRRFPGWNAWVFSGNPTLSKRIGLKPESKHVLYNGPIESRLLKFPISTTPIAGEGGPGWRRPSSQAKALATRLRKNLDRLRPWVEREGLTCYRLYDADVPEYNVAIDWYDGAVRIEEYARPRKVPEADAERRLRDTLLAVPEILKIDPANVVLRVRRRRAPGEQHGRRGDGKRFRSVQEGDLRFEINLEDYLDTGLFLDDRLLRQRIRESAKHRDFLNLFAYTCSASVAAAAGGARSTVSVDLSNTYLAWGRRNYALNGFRLDDHRFVGADVLQWIARRPGKQRYDLIFLAPPTYSRSKKMQTDFDVQRDHAELLESVSRLLTPRGEILFATNLRTFELEQDRLRGLVAREISSEITPPDFEKRPRLRAWSLATRRERSNRKAAT
jgi:23S rRNA (guanine2445-N2)-methyltransferase / 23S rRNA (guanine2069-N7)-methyltransferase